MYKNINSVIKINNLKKIIIESSSLYELNENIIDDTCCLCLELLNKKTCYECKNCHKGYCLQNDTCSGIIENISATYSFADSQNFAITTTAINTSLSGTIDHTNVPTNYLISGTEPLTNQTSYDWFYEIN